MANGEDATDIEKERREADTANDPRPEARGT